MCVLYVCVCICVCVCVHVYVCVCVHICVCVQAKKAGGGDLAGGREAEEAEQLLLINKPFTELTQMLTQLVALPFPCRRAFFCVCACASKDTC